MTPPQTQADPPSPLAALPHGTHDVPPGVLASLVTFLEMSERPAPRPLPPLAGQPRLEPLAGQAERYRALYRRIGERWLWFGRLQMAPAALAALLADPDVQAFAMVADGRDQGLLDLDFRVPGEAELSYFGLTDEAIGRGKGRWLMERAIALAWSRPIGRFWVHTCNHDHPAALAFYRRSGFTIVKTGVELVPDPRLDGLYPPDQFPNLPPSRSR